MGESKKPFSARRGLIGLAILAVAMVVVITCCAAPDEVRPVPPTPVLYDISPTVEVEPTPPRPTPAALDFPLPAPSSSSSEKIAQVTLGCDARFPVAAAGRGGAND